MTVLAGWNDRRLARRARPADGRPLRPFRWWHLLRRSLLSTTLEVEGRPVVHTVEVRHGGDSDGVVRAGLYVDGELRLQSRLPARFPVEGGHIEVRRGPAGLRTCRLVTLDGEVRSLQPDPASAEGRRLRLARRHPRASALVGAFSVLLLTAGLVVGALQAAEPVSQIPPIASTLGTFESPWRPPVWLNLALGLGAALAAVERALRLKYHWLLDGGAAT
ncbi:hypothetical protein [Nocardioides nanhaiensis]|uniref:Uncharacterized protein n=1 Tax=Nocardioides nanhaiensis TaxID=1476871 RepID=A0ABP8WJQ8_9ACTN